MDPLVFSDDEDVDDDSEEAEHEVKTDTDSEETERLIKLFSTNVMSGRMINYIITCIIEDGYLRIVVRGGVYWLFLTPFCSERSPEALGLFLGNTVHN